MRTQCRQQALVSTVAVVAWSVVLGLICYEPVPTSPLRMLFFAVLHIAGIASALAVLPWMLRGFIRDQTLAYVAGYMHREADDPEVERHLRVVAD